MWIKQYFTQNPEETSIHDLAEEDKKIGIPTGYASPSKISRPLLSPAQPALRIITFLIYQCVLWTHSKSMLTKRFNRKTWEVTIKPSCCTIFIAMLSKISEVEYLWWQPFPSKHWHCRFRIYTSNDWRWESYSKQHVCIDNTHLKETLSHSSRLTVVR